VDTHIRLPDCNAAAQRQQKEPAGGVEPLLVAITTSRPGPLHVSGPRPSDRGGQRDVMPVQLFVQLSDLVQSLLPCTDDRDLLAYHPWIIAAR
jgi:hypothetical protein